MNLTTREQNRKKETLLLPILLIPTLDLTLSILQALVIKALKVRKIETKCCASCQFKKIYDNHKILGKKETKTCRQLGCKK